MSKYIGSKNKYLFSMYHSIIMFASLIYLIQIFESLKSMHQHEKTLYWIKVHKNEFLVFTRCNWNRILIKYICNILNIIPGLPLAQAHSLAINRCGIFPLRSWLRRRALRILSPHNWVRHRTAHMSARSDWDGLWCTMVRIQWTVQCAVARVTFN